MLLLPEPFGPTTAVMPAPNSKAVRSAKDLNPKAVTDFKNKLNHLCTKDGFSKSGKDFAKPCMIAIPWTHSRCFASVFF
jgi:hypothetical protein